MKVVHVWARHLDTQWCQATCGAMLTHEKGYVAIPTRDWQLERATCLHCLKWIRDQALRDSRKHAEIAEKASETYDRVKRRRARKSGR